MSIIVGKSTFLKKKLKTEPVIGNLRRQTVTQSQYIHFGKLNQMVVMGTRKIVPCILTDMRLQTDRIEGTCGVVLSPF
jgi:hypothetical protein